MREVVRRYRNGQCTDTIGRLFGGLPDLGLFSSTIEISGFPEHQHPD
jgi:hypothetical protein